MAVTDWAKVHADVVDEFTRGWAAPGPHAWDGFLADDVEMVQPMLRDGTGRASWREETERLLELLPDLRGEVLTWAGRADRLFIELRLTATLGRTSLDVRVVDQFVLTPEGTVVRRESFFDPAPMVRAVLRSPGSWPAWWRSGVGPLLARRRLGCE